MASFNRTQIQALGRQHPAARTSSQLWAAHTSVTEAEPYAGPPDPDQTSPAALEASGTPTGTTDLEIRGQTGGHPGAAGSTVWRRDGSTEWHGYEAPATISSVHAVTWDSGAEYSRPCLAVSPEDTAVCVFLGVSGSFNVPYAVAWTVAAGTWGTKVALGPADWTDDCLAPCAVWAGDRFLAMWWAPTYDGVSYTLQVSESADGSTWSTTSEAATTELDVAQADPVSGSDPYYLPLKSRAAYKAGQILLIVEVEDDAGRIGMMQYASDDLGQTFARVVVSTSIATLALHGGPMDVVTQYDQFVIVHTQGHSNKITVRRMASAYQTWTSANPITDGSSANDPRLGSIASFDETSDCVAVVCPDGRTWAYAQPRDLVSTADTEYRVGYSEIPGLIWRPFGRDDDDPSVFDAPAQANRTFTAQGLRHWSAAYHRGSVLVVADSTGAAGTLYDENIWALRLGGHTTLTMPGLHPMQFDRDRVTWQCSLTPETLFNSHGIAYTYASHPYGGAYAKTQTLTTGGTQSETHTATAGLIRIRTGDGAGTAGQRYHRIADTLTDSGTGLVAMAQWTVGKVSNGSAGSSLIALRLEINEIGTSARVEVRMAGTSALLIDTGGAGSTLATVSGLTAATVYQFRMGLDKLDTGANNHVSLWYRQWTAHGERTWTHVGRFTVTDAGVGITNRIEWGHIASGGAGGIVESFWGEVLHSFGRYTAASGGYAMPTHTGQHRRWSDTVTADRNPSWLDGQPASSLGAAYLGDGVRLRCSRGPIVGGHTWTVPIEARRGAVQALASVNRSPRLGWKSTDTGQHTIALQMSGVDGYAASPYYVLGLAGINWKTGKVQRYASGAWSDVATIDASSGMASMPFTRSGRTVQPNGVVSGLYLVENELVGFTFQLSNGYRYKITANTEGSWSNTSTGQRAIITLAEADVGAPASGTGSVWSSDIAIVFQAQTASGWRLLVDSQSTADGDHRVGLMILGPCIMLAHPYDHSRNQDLILGSARVVAPSGVSTLTRPGPARRAVDVRWTETPLHELAASGTPNHLVAEPSGPACGARAGTVQQVAAMVRECDGEPVVYLPRIPYSASPWTMTRRSELMIGSMMGPVAVQTVRGDENYSETVTIGQLRIEEEV